MRVPASGRGDGLAPAADVTLRRQFERDLNMLPAPLLQAENDRGRKTEKLSADDRLDIMEHFAKYCRALNIGDEDGFVARFSSDGWIDHKPQGRCQGQDKIRDLLKEIWYKTPYNYLGRQHQATGFIMTREGEGVRVKAYWTINHWHNVTQHVYTYMLGDWSAYCVKEDDDWKFKSLEVIHWRRDTAPWVGDPQARYVPPEGAGDGFRVASSSVGYANDRAEIENLAATYLIALDAGDVETYVSTFTPDGVLNWAYGSEHGQEAIRKAIAAHAARKKVAPDATERVRLVHAILNHRITVNGASATAAAQWIGYTNDTPDRSCKLLEFGHYEDQLVKQHGRWLYKERNIFNEHLSNNRLFYPALGETDPRVG